MINQPYQTSHLLCFPPWLVSLNATAKIYAINYKCLIQTAAHTAPQWNTLSTQK